MLKGDLQWIRIPSGGVTILLVTYTCTRGIRIFWLDGPLDTRAGKVSDIHVD